MPFIIVGLVLLHIILLHEHGSNNPLGLIGNFVVASKSQVDGISFSPYFTLKDLYGLLIFGLFFIGFVMFIPNYAGHPDNYIPGNPMVTPAHIVPEWYFLPFYAMLRSIPNKLGGVIVLIFSIVVLALLPFVVTQNVRSNEFKPFQKIGF